MADSIPSGKEISTVELLIGSDYYLERITAEKTALEPGLYLLGSKLGWILSGRFGKRACNESNASMLIFSCPSRGGGRSTRLVRRFKKNLNLTIIGPTRTLKIQGFDHK